MEEANGADERARHHYEAERGALLWYLRSQGVPAHEAEDAVQAAFVRLLQASEDIREPRWWLRKVALNEYRRTSPAVRGSRRPTVVVPVPPAELPDPGEAADPAELTEQAVWAHDAIAGLPDKQRRVMADHVDGRSHQQIADDTGMSNAAVRQNLQRARRALRRTLRTSDERTPT